MPKGRRKKSLPAVRNATFKVPTGRRVKKPGWGRSLVKDTLDAALNAPSVEKKDWKVNRKAGALFTKIQDNQGRITRLVIPTNRYVTATNKQLTIGGTDAIVDQLYNLNASSQQRDRAWELEKRKRFAAHYTTPVPLRNNPSITPRPPD